MKMAALVAVMTLALTAVACGQESSSSADPTPPPSTVAQPSPDSPSPAESTSPAPAPVAASSIWGVAMDFQTGGNLAVYSPDAGATWFALREGSAEMPINLGLSAVEFADTENGWLAGSNLILATSDGGQTWRVQVGGEDSPLVDEFDAWDPLSIAAPDSDHVWIATTDGVLATTNGGKRWRRQPVMWNGTEYDPQAIVFADSEYGYALRPGAGHSLVFVTDDGGVHWTLAKDVKDVSIKAITCADRDHAWAVGEKGRILATGDGGRTWQTQHQLGGLALDGVSFIDDLQGWVVGHDSAGGADVMLTTSDGGATWEQSETDAYFRTVDFLDAQNGWATYDGGAEPGIASTSDGGQSWTFQPMSGSYDWSQILASRDDGWTWELIPDESGSEPYIDAGLVWVSRICVVR